MDPRRWWPCRRAEDEREARTRNRRYSLIGIISFAALLALVLAGVAFVQQRNAERQTGIADEQTQVAQVERDRADDEARLAQLAAGQAAAEAERAAEASQRAEQSADVAFARELAVAAVANIDVDSERALLLALEAMQATHAPIKEAVEALHQVVVASRVVMSVPGDFPAAFSADGALFATALGDDAVIRIWSVPNGEPVATLQGHTALVAQVEFTPDGSSLVSSSLDGTARRWDLTSQTEACRFEGHAAGVLSMSLARDGRRVAARSFDNTVRVWEAESCQELNVYEYGAFGLLFHPSGDQLAIAVAEGGAVVVEVETGAEILTAGVEARDVRFSPDGSLLAVAQGSQETLVVDTETGAQQFVVPGHSPRTEAVDFSPDGSFLATGGADGAVRVWDAESGVGLLVLNGVGSNVEHLTFDPASTFVAGAGTSGRVLVWDISRKGASEIVTIDAGSEPILRLSYGPDGTHLAASGGDGVVAVWESESGALVRDLDRDDGLEFGVWWSPDGELLSTSGPRLDSEAAVDLVTLWNLEGEIVADLVDHPFTFSAVVDHSGSLLATGGDAGVIRVWDWATGELQAELHPELGHMPELAWSPDGRWLGAATQDDAVWLWDPTTAETMILRGHRNVVNALAWHPDGTRLASAGEDGTVRIWTLADPADPLVISAHAATVQDLAWSSDGSRLASGGFDGTARVWDPNNGEELLKLQTAGIVFSVTLSPDAQRVAIGTDDGLIRVYTLDIDELISIAEERVTRSLTLEECRTYLHVEACPA